LSRLIKKVCGLIPKKLRRWIIDGFIRAEMHKPGKNALRYLLNLDSLVYQLSGFISIKYNGGRHVKHRLTGYHDFFVNRIRSGERILDIGCGRGEVAYEIVSRTEAHVVGIDNNEQWLNDAKQNYQHPNLKFILEDAEKFFTHINFDTVILSNVLEHIKRRISFLQNINKHIQPARFLIRVPMFDRDWRVPLKKELGLPYLLDPTHFIEYTQESFEKELAESELSVSHLEIHWGEIWSEVVPIVQGNNSEY
jgi:2-polyprenyl-3-methyl-5-hydroxy-6-metoxy-1,4-benzoquinol methylase